MFAFVWEDGMCGSGGGDNNENDHKESQECVGLGERERIKRSLGQRLDKCPIVLVLAIKFFFSFLFFFLFW